MGFSHVLLEVYCGFGFDESNELSQIPKFCKKGINNPGYHCLEHKCPFVSYTKCPNEIAYVGEDSEVIDSSSWIGFGGEMEPDNYFEREKWVKKWEDVCKKKIDEAYDEYISLKDGTNEEK